MQSHKLFFPSGEAKHLLTKPRLKFNVIFLLVDVLVVVDEKISVWRLDSLCMGASSVVLLHIFLTVIVLHIILPLPTAISGRFIINPWGDNIVNMWQRSAHGILNCVYDHSIGRYFSACINRWYIWTIDWWRLKVGGLSKYTEEMGAMLLMWEWIVKGKNKSESGDHWIST